MSTMMVITPLNSCAKFLAYANLIISGVCLLTRRAFVSREALGLQDDDEWSGDYVLHTHTNIASYYRMPTKRYRYVVFKLSIIDKL